MRKPGNVGLWVITAVFPFLLFSCSGDSAVDVQPQPETVDLWETVDLATDTAPPDGGVTDVSEDTDSGPFPLPELTEPAPFRIGTASGIMPVPLGIPTCGNMPAGGVGSPFVGNFSASTHIYQHPTIRTLAVEGGTSRLLFLRLDLIGTNTQVIERVTHDLSEVTGYDWSGRIIAGATHTHSSAGRLADGFIWSVLADSFFPELFESMISTMVDLSVEAILDMEPGRMGYGMAETDQLHNDRRCENPELRDDRLHFLRFDRADSTPKALLLVHSVHGTVFGASQHLLSRDVVGGIEEKVKESFDSPVEVLFFQAGAGDISPSGPAVDETGELPVIPHDFSRVEKIGQLAADAVQSVVWQIETSSEIGVASQSHYVPMGRDVIGYEDDEFPFEYGGAYCGTAVDADCWTGEPTPIEDLDKKCMDINWLAEGAGHPGESAPDRTLMTAALLGDVLLLTFPGEPVTQVLLNVEEGIRELFPEQETIVAMGYAQDYIGYSTPEWDFYQGGYEASGAIWGPKQGDYLTELAVDIGSIMLDDSFQPTFEDMGPYPILKPGGAPYKPWYSLEAEKIVTQPAAEAASGETVVFEFNGGDPWYLLPNVVLEKKVDGEFLPVKRGNGTVVDSLGYEIASTVTYDPPYKDDKKGKERIFTWRFEMPTDRRVSATAFPLKGTYRFHVTGRYRAPDGELEGVGYDLVSDPFVVQ